ncbi:MAG TPA: extracellular solute-binding protein, partial [Dehalococcoidia bacterium]|nr:extracellular solute-binding protein [Dehalococcoidia bacterium]
MKLPGNIDRREFLKMAGMAGIALVGAACAPAAAPTPTPTKAPAAASPKPAAVASPAGVKPEEVRAQLYEAAKKEGQLLVYTTGTSKEVDDYRKVFSKTYPGVEVKDYAGTGEQIIEKMLTEFKAGRVNADFVLIPFEQWVVMLKEGLAEKWDSPEKASFPAEAVDPNGLWVVDQAVVHVISYNTQLVPAAAAPKNYQDLLNPVFKGKLGLEKEAYSWFTQRTKVWGKDKAIDYAKKLAAQQPTFIKGHTTLADAVVSGEVWAAVNVYLHRVEQQKEKGAPVKWAADEPTGVELNAIGLPKGAPHPNAGKLFLDWR